MTDPPVAKRTTLSQQTIILAFLQAIVPVILVFALALLTASCQGFSLGARNSSSVDSTESISVSPSAATLSSGGSKQFTASVSNISNSAVTWSASAGTISSSGLFTAPTVTWATAVSVTATSVRDPSKQATAAVTVNPGAPTVTISISPTTATLSSGGQQQFTSTVTNSNNTAVTWGATAGTMSSSGLFTAPSVTSTTQISITATSVADPTKQANANVMVNPNSGQPPAPAIVTSALPNVTSNWPYKAWLVASGGQLPYQWSIAGGALPPGLQLSSSAGSIVGDATTTGLFSFTVELTDANSQSSTAAYTLAVLNDNQPNTIPSSYFGVNLTEITNWPEGYVGSLGKAPATTWPYLEPSRGVYDWSRLDQFANAAQGNGVTFFYSNNYVPAWAATDTSTCSTGAFNVTICRSGVNNIQDWDDFVTALVTRYQGRIQMYELWNEPDNYFLGTMDQIVTLTTHMYKIVRFLDPQALIAAPSALDMDWLNSYWTAGGVTTFDIATTHSYPGPTNEVAEVICAFRSVPLRSLLVTYGIRTPIWDTEGSWGGVNALSDPDLQAAYVARSAALHWACNVPRLTWYTWDGGGQYPYYGELWAELGGLTEAGVAYENVFPWLNGASMPNSCLMNGAAIPAAPALYSGVYACELTRPNGYEAEMVWDTEGPSTYLAPEQFTQYRDLAGNAYAIPSDHQVTIGYKPVLLEN